MQSKLSMENHQEQDGESGRGILYDSDLEAFYGSSWSQWDSNSNLEEEKHD